MKISDFRETFEIDHAVALKITLTQHTAER
jgi:hypothetical protein